MWTLLVIFCFAFQVKANGWDDFTNNLATDLAPLVALFGEQVTKQFLSESTSPLDNIIFAVAPLGILTAVVSVIRVLGSASLRAFVGRAQEGRGAAEAELCSSTSNDVCELWNNGGIARVFGRPKILEFIFVEDEINRGEGLKTPEPRESQENGKSQESKKSQGTEKKENENSQETKSVFYESFSGSEVHCPTAGIYKPKDYEEKYLETVLHKDQSFDSEKADKRGFAPNPNLSLNIGIRKFPGYYLWGAAIFGCLLQASVLAYAAWAIYVKGLWKEGQSVTYLYFWLDIIGTVLLVVGMFLCAWLIEQSTKERVFPLDKRIFWLQPVNESVGDQTFEAFAYSTNELNEYTTSWKEEGQDDSWKKRLFVLSAISVSMVGFVLQFTGLRGLHSSIALYQFIATLIMALVRSLLRTRRLKDDKNLLKDRTLQDEVKDHELDWQTLRIEETLEKVADGKSSDNGLCWSIGEYPPTLESTIKEPENLEKFQRDHIAYLKINEDGSAACTSCLDTQNAAEDQDERDSQCANALVKWIATVEGDKSSNDCQSRPPNLAKRLLCYRSRLSYLTNDGAPTISQRWGSVVREQAVKLQAAIQSVANYIFSDACQAKLTAHWSNTAAFCWALNVRHPSAGNPEIPVYLMVRRARGQWRVDLCQLEAVLGLWVWSIKNERKCEKREKEEKCRKELEADEGLKGILEVQVEQEAQSEQEMEGKQEARGSQEMKCDSDPILSRKVFTIVSKAESDMKQAERELNFWVLREKRPPIYDHLNEYYPVGSETSKRELKPFSSLSLPMARKLLFGSKPQEQEQQRREMVLLSIQTNNSLLVMAAQDIFASLIDALASVTSRLEGVKIVQSLRSDAVVEEVISTSEARPFLGFSHNHTERLVDLFIQAGLGTREDALMSVIPPFYSRSLLPSLVTEYELLKSLARKMRCDQKWPQAENLLTTLYSDASLYGKEDTNPRTKELFKELCELYRKAMRSEESSHRLFGYLGVCKMNVHSEETKKIKQDYAWAALELAKLREDDRKTMRELQDGELQAQVKENKHPSKTISEELQARIKENERPLETGMTLQDAIGWPSKYLIGLVIAEKFKKEIKEKIPYTELLMWAAQRGYKELVEDLLETGEEGVDSKDRDGRTPLSLAAAGGHEAVVKLLLATGEVDVDSKDGDGRTPLSRAAAGGHEAVMKLLEEALQSVDKITRTPARV